MSASLILTDGQELYISSMSLMGLYHLVAIELHPTHPEFARWLMDISTRDSAFMGLDMRALKVHEAEAFYSAAIAAYQKLVAKFGLQVGENCFAQGALCRLMKMIGAPVEIDTSLSYSKVTYAAAFDGKALDFSDIWDLNAEPIRPPESNVRDVT